MTQNILKAPEILEEWLFANPDYAIQFNELTIEMKNEWIKSIWDAKKPKKSGKPRASDPQTDKILELQEFLKISEQTWGE